MPKTYTDATRRLLAPAECNQTRETLLAKQLAAHAKAKAAGERVRPFKTLPELRTFKLNDGGGLYLEIPPNDIRNWRFTYRRPASHAKAGEPNALSFGRYPDVTLVDARAKCDAARGLLAGGIDPADAKLEVAKAAASAEAVLFCTVANDWWDEIIKQTSKKNQARVKIEFNELMAAFGQRDIRTILTAELGTLLKRIYDSGRRSKTRRVLALASRIWSYAVSEGKGVETDIALPFLKKKERFKHKSKKYPAITDGLKKGGLILSEAETLVGKLLRDIRALTTAPVPLTKHHRRFYAGNLMAAAALEMMALTFPRPDNINAMRWDHINGAIESDFAHGVWIIPEDEMKMDKPHRIHLSRQALAILKRLYPITCKDEYVFSLTGKPLNKNRLTELLRDIGYDTAKVQCAHGFRSMASTLCNQWRLASKDAIELQLAHVDEDKTRDDYNMADYWDERKKLMQDWADQLDRLRGDNVVSIKAA